MSRRQERDQSLNLGAAEVEVEADIDAETRRERIRELARSRPRDRFVRWSLLGFLGAISGAWALGNFRLDELWSERRRRNFERFAEQVLPAPWREGDRDLATLWNWAAQLMREEGWEAVAATVAISIVAIAFASLVGTPLAFLGARNLMRAEPYLPGGATPSRWRRGAWSLSSGIVRFVQIATRTLPEYLLAFLALALFSSSAWPAVLALAIHNAGILGRLQGETIENSNPRSLTALRAGGSTRVQIALFGIIPLTLPRFLLYVFYRWESCVREATVLGMLGIASLGFLISDARVRDREDEFVFFIFLGCLIVLAGDGVSALARAAVRKAS